MRTSTDSIRNQSRSQKVREARISRWRSGARRTRFGRIGRFGKVRVSRRFVLTGQRVQRRRHQYYDSVVAYNRHGYLVRDAGLQNQEELALVGAWGRSIFAGGLDHRAGFMPGSIYPNVAQRLYQAPHQIRRVSNSCGGSLRRNPRDDSAPRPRSWAKDAQSATSGKARGLKLGTAWGGLDWRLQIQNAGLHHQLGRFAGVLPLESSPAKSRRPSFATIPRNLNSRRTPFISGQAKNAC